MISSSLEKIYFKTGKSWLLFFFLTGIIYSIIGIFIGLNTGIAILSVFIIAIALIPTIDKFISLTELLEGRTKVIESKDKKLYLIELRSKARKISIKNIFHDYSDVIIAYTSYFLTILFVFLLVSLILKNSSQLLFGLTLIKESSNQAVFFSLLKNNLSVFSIAFLLSFIFEFGATFVITWNAALWGTSLGELLKQTFVNKEIGMMLSLSLIAPHLMLEAMAYFFAAIAGALLSKAIVKEKINSNKFNRIAIQAIFLIGFGLVSLITAAYIESLVIGYGYL